MTDIKQNVENRIIYIKNILDNLTVKTKEDSDQSISLQNSLQEMVNVYGFDRYVELMEKKDFI